MQFLSRLLRRLMILRAGASGIGSRRTATAHHPYVLKNPVIGFLNLLGERGAALAESDSRALADLFVDCRSSASEVPRCAVLLIYCQVDASGRIEGVSESLRGLIKRAGAHVAILASENEPQACINALKARNDWTANVVFVLNRKGPIFAEFFRRLFEMMGQGTSMPSAWVKISPQIPHYDNPDAPEAIFAAEAGHLTFSKRA